MPLCSIFIATYNGEKWLKETLDSITCQTFNDFDVFCVDDGSSDATCAIINDYVQKDSRIHLVRKEHEGCVPHSWRTVVPFIDGEYVQYMSQDDFLEKDYMLKMSLSAKEMESDAIVPTVRFYRGCDDDRVDSGWKGNLDIVISGREAFLASLDYTIPGFCWWRQDIVKSILFVYDTFNSDELMQRIWFSKCSRVAFSNALFFYRQNNPNAITKVFSQRQFGVLKTNLQLLDLMRQENVPLDIVNKRGAFYYQSLFVLGRQYYLHRKAYSQNDKFVIARELHHSWLILRDFASYISTSNSKAKRILYRATAFHFMVFKVVCWTLH